MLENSNTINPLCKYVGLEQNDGEKIIEWLQLGPQGVGVQELMEMSKYGVGFKATTNVVLVLRVAAKKTDYCTE